jgi:glycosyltransferase involved in cell wall biosynthesis
MHLSICVPVFNEENSLREAVEDLIATLSPQVAELSLIIVDDGSFDSTSEVVRNIAREYPQVQVIRHEKNLGVGTAYRDALAIAPGEYFTWFPADHENAAEQFISGFPHLNPGTVVTYYHAGKDHRLLLRKILSGYYTMMINRCFRLKIKYYNELSIFPTQKLRSFSLSSEGPFIFAESLIKAARKGCLIIELPVFLRGRQMGKSKIFNPGTVLGIIRDIYRVFLNNFKAK